MFLIAGMTAAAMAMTGMIISAVSAAAATAGAIYSGYAQNKAAKRQAAAAEQQAEAQARESERQAKLENERAGIEQVQGEQEAEKRSRALAADIGSTYANAAGNGLAVDGSSLSDTVGRVLTTQAAEGQYDISTIKDNAAMNVWTRQSNANSLIASAGNTRIAGQNTASSLRASGRSALIGGFISGTGTALQGAGQLASSGADYKTKYGSK